MKLFIVLALAMATASGFDLRGNEFQSSKIEVPVKVPEGRIINGEDASPGQIPFQVGLSLSKGILKKYWCGGSLLNSEWVLTAAHCTDGIKKVVVMLGSTNRNEPELKYTVYANDIIIHSEWDAETLKNDISLIRIPTTSFSETIQPVKLPAIANSYSSYAGDLAIASGWGRISDDEKVSVETLQYAEMGIVSNFVCAKVYGRTFTKSNLCVATLDGSSTCQGDSGGPLLLASTHVQVAITSFGSKSGCTKGLPVAFTRLTSYLRWIAQYTKFYS